MIVRQPRGPGNQKFGSVHSIERLIDVFLLVRMEVPNYNQRPMCSCNIANETIHRFFSQKLPNLSLFPATNFHSASGQFTFSLSFLHLFTSYYLLVYIILATEETAETILAQTIVFKVMGWWWRNRTLCHSCKYFFFNNIFLSQIIPFGFFSKTWLTIS